jgi:hypothetical protein
MTPYDRDGEYTLGERSVVALEHTDTIRELAKAITKGLTGHSFDAHSHAVFTNLEDQFLRAVYESYLPTRVRWEQDVADDEAWESAEARRAA